MLPVDPYLGHPLRAAHVTDVDLHVLTGAGQQQPVVGEADGADRPLQPRERLHKQNAALN